ncbi:hypothetical protein [Pseudaminobacter soli (ex Li et al. 2025)]|uniref:hypothetical protein n=1 Tax=Pseudaminobacter soli (ex Li et al. 2025) TaxID=1295366 RepID=UPI0015E6A991|nr:hypothetical protein [Mesorhizobium soli]
MRNLALHHEQLGSFSAEVLDELDALMQRAVEELKIVDQADRNEVAARTCHSTRSAAEA